MVDTGKALLELFAVVTVTTGAGEGGGEIVFVNNLFCVLSGWAKEEIVGQKIDVLIPEESRAAHHHYRLGFEVRPSSRPMGPDREVVLRHKQGHKIRVWVGLDPDTYEDPATVTAVILPMDIGRSYGLAKTPEPEAAQ